MKHASACTHAGYRSDAINAFTAHAVNVSADALQAVASLCV
jgi:hypothetical protein